MKKVYLKPAIEILEEELTQMLCSSTVINPGEPNVPAGARESGVWDDAMDYEGDDFDNKVW
jgi:hypothetical protein